jgi:hypothetical protein
MHGKQVRFVSRIRPIPDHEFKYRNVIDFRDLEGMKACEARYLVVHKNFLAEYEARGCGRLRKQSKTKPDAEIFEFLESRLGPPLIEKDGIALYALDRR